MLAWAAALAFSAAPAAAAEVDTVPFEARATDGVVLRGHVFLPMRISGVTRSGRRVTQTRRYRTCIPRRTPR